MGIKIIAKICKDPAFIYHTMVTIMQETGDDYTDPYKWQPAKGDIFVEMATDKGERIGLYKLDSWNHTTIKFHPNILPKYRGRHLLASTEPIYKFLLSNFPRVNKYIGFIPECFPNVITYGTKNGWKKEGVISEGFFKYNQYHDVVQLGITSAEMRGFLNG